jgi:multicomponent Na+:H+ antiporter subunit G
MAIVVSIFLLAGAIFILIASIGILRLPGLMTRIHAASKATSFGILLLMTGLAIFFSQWTIIVKSVLLIMFIYLTAPLAASVIARSAKEEQEPE